jgi:hypothetical protein
LLLTSVLAQSEATGLIELVKAVGLAGALLVLILVWLTRSFIPKLQDDNAKARSEFLKTNEASRKEFLQALDRVEERHERSIDKVIGAFERERSENQTQHRDFDSRIEELERDADGKRRAT